MTFSTITAALMGLGLAATAGFRVFVPLLIGSIAIRGDMVTPAEGFEWIGSTPALILFTVATVLEVTAYYFPWLDNLLDTIATPSAVIAGVLLSASFIGESNDLFRWSVAIIAGGGISAIVQGATIMLCGGSSATTGGVANPVVSTGELGASVVGGVLSLFIPALTILAALLFAFLIIRFIHKKEKSSPKYLIPHHTTICSTSHSCQFSIS